MDREGCREQLVMAGLGPVAARSWTEAIAIAGHLRSRGWLALLSPDSLGSWERWFPGLGFGLIGPTPTVVTLSKLLKAPPELRLSPPTAHDRAQVEAILAPILTGPPRPISVLDRRCGDGALLEAVFDRLVAWRWEFRGAPPDLEETRRLVRACIHGLDPDPFLVRRARVRLGLRTLDGVAPELAARSVTLFDPGPLPDLRSNLRQGADPDQFAKNFDVVFHG
jgi:hypothetical protein